MNFLDEILQKISLYKLTLYYLIILSGYASILGFLKVLPYSGFAIIFSAIFLVLVSILFNYIFARSFGTCLKYDSTIITALILALIITPLKSAGDIGFLLFAAILAVASKYILAFRNKHIMNPAAVAVAITALFAGASASWWVGTAAMLPMVILGGLLIVRKMRKTDLIYYFFFAVALTMLAFAIINSSSIVTATKNVVLDSGLFFLAFVMLTEPLTMPRARSLQIAYGIIVGFLFVPQVHIFSFYFTPELALVSGNLLAFLTRIPPKKIKQEMPSQQYFGANINSLNNP